MLISTSPLNRAQSRGMKRTTMRRHILKVALSIIVCITVLSAIQRWKFTAYILSSATIFYITFRSRLFSARTTHYSKFVATSKLVHRLQLYRDLCYAKGLYLGAQSQQPAGRSVLFGFQEPPHTPTITCSPKSTSGAGI